MLKFGFHTQQQASGVVYPE